MAYNAELAERVREYLAEISNIKMQEKKMFGGLAFMINDKMCACVSGENLMCRVDPTLHDELSAKVGFRTMVMKGRELKGYCYVSPDGIKSKKDFEFWLDLCLDFNKRAKSSKKQKY